MRAYKVANLFSLFIVFVAMFAFILTFIGFFYYKISLGYKETQLYIALVFDVVLFIFLYRLCLYLASKLTELILLRAAALLKFINFTFYSSLVFYYFYAIYHNIMPKIDFLTYIYVSGLALPSLWMAFLGVYFLHLLALFFKARNV